MPAISNSPSGSLLNNLTNVSNSKKINYGNLVAIMVVYIIIAFVLAPMIGYFISKKGGLVIGFAVGMVIILLLWLLFGRLLI